MGFNSMKVYQPPVKVNSVACPRCGCWAIRNFKCGCGAVHSDYCVNCGRYTSLGVTEHVELSEIDARCDHGAVPHDHDVAEKAARIGRFFSAGGTRRRTAARAQPSTPKSFNPGSERF